LASLRPSFEEFKTFASGDVTHVPVYRQILADTLTPVSAYQRLTASLPASEHSFLLESVEGGEFVGRYSFLGARPSLVLSATLNEVVVRSRAGGEMRSRGVDPLDALEQLLGQYRSAEIPGLPRFSGGAVGYASYDIVRLYEPLPKPPPRSLGLSDLVFGVYRTLIVFDQVQKTIRVVHHADVVDRDLAQAYAEAGREINSVVEALKSPVESPLLDVEPRRGEAVEFESNFTREAFEAVVRRIKEYIAAGDIIQCVPSQRLRARTRASALDIYRALRVINPSPYMFLLSLGEAELIGSSPEVMVRLENGVITVRPIAGTRRRGETAEEDTLLAAELLADPKERAEHVMLLDLGRNDVGRVAVYGSVKVTEQMAVEYYSHVMHIVSNVEGKLKPSMTAFDLLRSALPAGTVSGAPKVRAMQIIDEVEPDRRGVYAGAVGYFDFHGNFDTCIAIRTMVKLGDAVHVQAGGGVVADSVPASEYQETLNKARALLQAVAVAERALAGNP